MKPVRFAAPVAIAVAALAFVACESSTEADGLFDDSAVTLDVAATSGDAMAQMIETMTANDAAAGGSAELGTTPPAATTDVSVSGTRTCYDVNAAVMAGCTPFSSVRTIVTAVTASGSRTNSRTTTGGATITSTGVVHRSASDTTHRIFSGASETSRVHNDVGQAHDTSTFTDGTLTRKIAETAADTVKSITFNLPRSSNPYPASGSIVRNDAVRVDISKEGRSVGRDVTRRVEVIFPADAQGNVVLKVNAKTCNLNLVTHAVTNCQ